MKTIVLCLLVSIGVFAAPVFEFPPLQPVKESVAITPDPYLGANLIYIPGSSWVMAWEDIKGLGDRDYNDFVASISFTPASGMALLHAVSAYSHEMKIFGVTLTKSSLGFVPFSIPLTVQPGDVVPVEFRVLNTNLVYFAGGGAGNPDGLPHAMTACVVGCELAEVPEPQTWIAAASGLFLFAWLLLPRKGDK